jgi:hypothetical protein
MSVTNLRKPVVWLFSHNPEPELTPVELELESVTIALLETYAEEHETSIDGVIKLLVERYFASPLVTTEETYEEAN